MTRFKVRFLRKTDGEPSIITYEAIVEAPDAGTAGTIVGYKIRHNDLDEITVTAGTHIAVEPPGSDANLTDMYVHAEEDNRGWWMTTGCT